MSISQGAALSAIAFQFAAAIESYDEEAERMVRAGGDLALYPPLVRRMDEMRLYASALPQTNVAWVEVMIRHFELTHALWRRQQQGAEPGALESVRDQHRSAVRFLLRRVLQLLPRH